MSKAQEMPFLDHLEELRWRLIKSLVAIIVGGMVAFFFIDDIIKLLIAPTEHILSLIHI